VLYAYIVSAVSETFHLQRLVDKEDIYVVVDLISKYRKVVDYMPCYASVGHFLQRTDITPLLVKLVVLTSLPLTTVEKDFAIDSTGYGTNVFQRWFSFKYGREINSRRWVKCHFMTGVKTNIITGVKITSEFDNDCPELPGLVNITAEHFDMNDVVCDKAYLSQNNLELINSHGATPYIPFKSNSKARNHGSVWKKMYYLFMLKNDEFLEHYHKRSNAESTIQMSDCSPR